MKEATLVSLGTVAVETGQVLMIDPCMLFTVGEWQELVIPLGKTLGEGRVGLNKAILKILALRHDRNVNFEELAVIAGTKVGDGCFNVTRGAAGLVVNI